MNAAMMRAELKKQFPNVFSLPGETEIKKYISLLFMKSKKDTEGLDLDDDQENDAQTIEIRQTFDWLNILWKIIENEPQGKPKDIYKKLLVEVGEENKLHLPDIKDVKKKISQMKQVVRRKLMRSIVQS